MLALPSPSPSLSLLHLFALPDSCPSHRNPYFLHHSALPVPCQLTYHYLQALPALVPSHCWALTLCSMLPPKIRYFTLSREDTTQKWTVLHAVTNYSESRLFTRNYTLYKTLALAIIKNPNALRRMNS